MPRLADRTAWNRVHPDRAPRLHYPHNMRCLVVDDDDSPRELIVRVLRGAGHRVAGAADMAGARDVLLAGDIDVILLDLEMPGVHGAEAIVEVRGLAPRSRVLVVSGHEDARHVVSALEAGADGYLLKDELGDTLRDAVQAVRAGHSPLSPRVAAVMLRRMREKPAGEPDSSTKLARIRS